MERGVSQVAQGKPTAIFVQGDYGLGKSSFANYTRVLATLQHNLHGIYATLGGAKTLNDVAAIVLEATLKSDAYEHTRTEIVRSFLGKLCK